MDDLIDRQKAIDVSALKEWVENWFTKNRYYHPYAKNNNIPITELYDILELMPSAQPEIIYCKDCEWFGKAGCAIEIVDDSDKPTENDFCSFAERRTDGSD